MSFVHFCLYCVHEFTFCTIANVCVFPQITQEVGRCKPVAGALDSVEMIFCSQMVESLVRIGRFTLNWSVDIRNCFENVLCLSNCHAVNHPCSLSIECILVQSGLVLDLLYAQHHLFYQISQVLQENEVLWCLWVSSTINLKHASTRFIYTHIYLCVRLWKNDMTDSCDFAALPLTAVIFVFPATK